MNCDSPDTVLVIEDEPNIGKLVQAYLSKEGYTVAWERRATLGLEAFEREPVTLVLLDVGLPDGDGFEVCRRIRSRSGVPIIMLTARDEEQDRIAGLSAGADDYVCKPFSPGELMARVRAVLRRTRAMPPQAVYELGDIRLVRATRAVTVDGAPIDLREREFELLECLMEHPGRWLSRDELLDRVWGFDYPGGTRTVDMHVAGLRRKLGRPNAITTRRGAGYRMEA
jgi:DNA-binding response OmpR family regulator